MVNNESEDSTVTINLYDGVISAEEIQDLTNYAIEVCDNDGSIRRIQTFAIQRRLSVRQRINKENPVMKQRFNDFLLILILVIGLSLLLYPSVSNWWNFMHQSSAIASYAEVLARIDPEVYQKARADARSYNETLVGRSDSRFEMTENERQYYDTLLNPAGDRIMGIVEIPEIQVTLPLYHGTSEEVLQVAVGHIEGSSLPVGGKGTHCAISGHRGLPDARLFTDLDQLVEGDRFLLHILDDSSTYLLSYRE